MIIIELITIAVKIWAIFELLPNFKLINFKILIFQAVHFWAAFSSFQNCLFLFIDASYFCVSYQIQSLKPSVQEPYLEQTVPNELWYEIQLNFSNVNIFLTLRKA